MSVHTTDVAEIEGLTALHVVEGYVWCSKHGEVHGDTLNPYGYVEVPGMDFCKPGDHRAMFMDSDDNVQPVGEYSGLAAEKFLRDTAPFICHCQCHQPMGFKLVHGQAPPPGMRPCDECKEAHMGHPTSDEDPSSFVPESGLTPGGSCRTVPSPVRSNPVPLTVRRHTAQSRAIWRTELLNALPVDMLQEDRERIADDLIDRAIALGDELRRKRLIDKLMDAAETTEDMANRNTLTKLLPAEVFREWSDLMADAAEEIRSVM